MIVNQSPRPGVVLDPFHPWGGFFTTYVTSWEPILQITDAEEPHHHPGGVDESGSLGLPHGFFVEGGGPLLAEHVINGVICIYIYICVYIYIVKLVANPKPTQYGVFHTPECYALPKVPHSSDPVFFQQSELAIQKSKASRRCSNQCSKMSP